MQTTKPATEPISERTRAVLTIQSQLQEVTSIVREIRETQKKGETWRAALWRAVKQFIGDMSNGH